MSKTCSECGRRLSDTATANTSQAIELPAAILPGLVQALTIGRNTALMSRNSHLQDLMEALRADVIPLVPEVSKHFSNEEWAEIMTRARKGARINVEVAPVGRSWNPSWRLEVVDADGTPWVKRPDQPIATNSFEDKEHVENLAELLRDEIIRQVPL